MKATGNSSRGRQIQSRGEVALSSRNEIMREGTEKRLTGSIFVIQSAYI